MPKALPPQPHIDWLKKAAKEQLAALRMHDASAKLHQAQLAVANDYGFQSWRALKARVDTLSLDGQIIAAVKEGRARDLDKLLAQHPRKIGDRQRLNRRAYRRRSASPLIASTCCVARFHIGTRDTDNATAPGWPPGTFSGQAVDRAPNDGERRRAPDRRDRLGHSFQAGAGRPPTICSPRCVKPTIFSAVASTAPTSSAGCCR